MCGNPARGTARCWVSPVVQVNEKFDELQQEKKAFYEEQFHALLQLHCGIDDSHVDYVNVWKRQYDATKDRCVGARGKGNVCVPAKPAACAFFVQAQHKRGL